MISDSNSDMHRKATQDSSVCFRASNHPPRERTSTVFYLGEGVELWLSPGMPNFPTFSLSFPCQFSSLSRGSDAEPRSKVLKSSQVLGRG